ncbi:MAG: response regulator transcription factor [Candidatus Neomarinimicrobiota bacterium]
MPSPDPTQGIDSTYSNDSNRIAVLIVEDHTIVRDGLRMLLENESNIEVVGECSNGRAAVEFCSKTTVPDIILMDISMPLQNGLEATRFIKKDFPRTQVLILSMHYGPEYVNQALSAGASGFLLKSTAAHELITAVNEINRGKAYFSPEISKTIIDLWKRKQRSKKERQPPAAGESILTQREREVLQLIAEGYTAPQIADQLFISDKTVAKHRQNIRDKLNIHTVAGLTRYALQNKIIH